MESSGASLDSSRSVAERTDTLALCTHRLGTRTRGRRKCWDTAANSSTTADANGWYVPDELSTALEEARWAYAGNPLSTSSVRNEWWESGWKWLMGSSTDCVLGAAPTPVPARPSYTTYASSVCSAEMSRWEGTEVEREACRASRSSTEVTAPSHRNTSNEDEQRRTSSRHNRTAP